MVMCKDKKKKRGLANKHEKMLDIANHYGDINQNYNEISLHPLGWLTTKN